MDIKSVANTYGCNTRVSTLQQFSEPELKARDAMVSRLEQKRKRVESELERVQNQLTPIRKEMNGYKEEVR